LLRPFLWVGRISYSLYLTHVLVVVSIHELVVPRIRSTWPASVVIAVVTSLAIGVSVCLAWLFYTYVESRFLAPSTQRTRSASPVLDGGGGTLSAPVARLKAVQLAGASLDSIVGSGSSGTSSQPTS
jgi:peptidoglycan/LPS O-acetylase OafA/YrhL